MAKLKIFIIDDDPTTCDLLETILNMEGYGSASVNQIGNEGIIPLLNEHTPDILILDFHLGATITLPYMSNIRKNPTWKHLPVLMTSAINQQEHCIAAGATDFILKPFAWDDIINAIGKIRDNLAYQEA